MLKEQSVNTMVLISTHSTGAELDGKVLVLEQVKRPIKAGGVQRVRGPNAIMKRRRI
jgi:hypothetical protein